MSHTVNIRKLIDGPRHALFHVFIQGDGKSVDLVNRVIINPITDLTPPLLHDQVLSLVKVWYGLSGFDVKLSFLSDASPDCKCIWVIPAGTLSGHVNFNEFGGISDKSGIDASGKLVLSTSGLMTTADQGSLVIKVSKHTDLFTMP